MAGTARLDFTAWLAFAIIGVVLGFDGFNNSISAELFYELEELSRLVAITYCVGNQGILKPFDCLSHCDDFPDFQLVETWSAGLLDSSSCGYVALAHSAPKRIVVAFRGSNSLSDTLYDLMTQPADYVPFPIDSVGAADCEGCRVHSGFMASWNSTREVLLPVLRQLVGTHPDYQLVLIGHSLGGAIAGLAALEFAAKGWNPTVTTFGEPRFGNEEMAGYVDQVFFNPKSEDKMKYRRVTHVSDPVPLLPFEKLGWAMHSGEIFIDKESLPPAIGDLRRCEGPRDGKCIAGPTKSTEKLATMEFSDAGRLLREQRDGFGGIPGLPSEWQLWEILFAHRQYFWRVGLCWDPQNLEYPRPSS